MFSAPNLAVSGVPNGLIFPKQHEVELIARLLFDVRQLVGARGDDALADGVVEQSGDALPRWDLVLDGGVHDVRRLALEGA